MKKVYLNEMDQEKRNELIKKNSKLMNQLQEYLYDYEMFCQEEEGRYMLGEKQYEYIEIKDNYNSFYLVLKNWRKFIDNLDTGYFATDEQTTLYNNILKDIKKHDNMDCYSDEFYKLDAEIEEKSKQLLQLCEDQLHQYEKYADEDDAIEYADEMDQLEGYYIEEQEDGSSDNVIRKDISFTECYI